MYTTCIQHAYNMHTTCIQHVPNMYTTCIQHSKYARDRTSTNDYKVVPSWQLTDIDTGSIKFVLDLAVILGFVGTDPPLSPDHSTIRPASHCHPPWYFTVFTVFLPLSLGGKFIHQPHPGRMLPQLVLMFLWYHLASSHPTGPPIYILTRFHLSIMI